MRISDWSSDVCSSDLLRRGGQQGHRNPDEFLQAADVLHRGGRQIGPGARAHGALGPAGDALIDRLRPRLQRRLRGQVVEPRSEERRGGKACVGTVRSGWSPYTSEKKKKTHSQSGPTLAE